jgi:hypothetical protein
MDGDFRQPIRNIVEPGRVSTTGILLFRDREIVDRSDEIYDLLARSNLIRSPPDFIQPGQLSAYANSADVARLYRALWVARRNDGAHFDSFPQINLYPAIVVERRDGQLITVIDTLRPRIKVPHDYSGLRAHLASVGRDSDLLLQAVNDELAAALVPAPANMFPGFTVLQTLAAQPPATAPIRLLKSWRGPNEFLLVTGTSIHYLLERPLIELCAGHSWNDCHQLRENASPAAVVSRSFDPSSFFVTLEAHHCAHRQVHQRRSEHCHIAPFEEFLCCRACTLQDVCWSGAELGRLPCGIATRLFLPALYQRERYCQGYGNC